MPPNEQTRWFSECVQPHEGALRAYLMKRFPSLRDHDDLVQESFLRVVRNREKIREGCGKSYLFVVAHNVALDLVRRRNATPHEATTPHEELPGLAESPDAAEFSETRQRQEILIAAMATLPPRCREVMMLRYSDGLGGREIAGRLGLSRETVKAHLAKGVRVCTLFFARQGVLEKTTRANGAPAL